MSNQEQFNNQNIAMPPEPEIEIRTMESDTRLAQQGTATISSQPASTSQDRSDISGYQYGFPGSYSDQARQSSEDSGTQQIVRQKTEIYHASKSSALKIILVILAMIIFSALAGFLAYYLTSKFLK